MDGNLGKKHEPPDVREAAIMYHRAGMSSREIYKHLVADGLLRPTASKSVKTSIESAAGKIRKWIRRWKKEGCTLSKRQKKHAKSMLIRQEVRAVQRRDMGGV